MKAYIDPAYLHKYGIDGLLAFITDDKGKYLVTLPEQPIYMATADIATERTDEEANQWQQHTVNVFLLGAIDRLMTTYSKAIRSKTVRRYSHKDLYPYVTRRLQSDLDYATDIAAYLAYQAESIFEESVDTTFEQLRSWYIMTQEDADKLIRIEGMESQYQPQSQFLMTILGLNTPGYPPINPIQEEKPETDNKFSKSVEGKNRTDKALTFIFDQYIQTRDIMDLIPWTPVGVEPEKDEETSEDESYTHANLGSVGLMSYAFKDVLNTQKFNTNFYGSSIIKKFPFID